MLIDQVNASNFKGLVLREFGHALGLINEQLNPNASISWNAVAVYKEYSNVSRAQVYHEILNKYDKVLPFWRPFDFKSVMMFPVDRKLTLDGFESGENNEISDGDAKLIAKLYPNKEETPPSGYGIVQVGKGAKSITTNKIKKPHEIDMGLEVIKKGNKYGFIDKTGKIIVPFEYDYADSFSEGLARVRKGRKWGYIDKVDQLVILFQFDEATSFDKGLARVKKEGKSGYINKTGKAIIPIIYDYTASFHEGLAEVKLGHKWGFINMAGGTVIPFDYEETDPFKDGLARVRKGEKVYYIDKTGQEVEK